MYTLTTQVANDLRNESLLLEVYKEDECVAIVERFDTEKTLRFQMFVESLDVACVQEILRVAHIELQKFEDGTPLSEANRDFSFRTKR